MRGAPRPTGRLPRQIEGTARLEMGQGPARKYSPGERESSCPAMFANVAGQDHVHGDLGFSHNKLVPWIVSGTVRLLGS